MNPLNPKKLLLTKWTAVKPIAKQKHFLVSRVIQPEQPTDPIQDVKIEAVFSKATQIIAWRELQNDSVWRHEAQTAQHIDLGFGAAPGAGQAIKAQGAPEL